MRIKLVFLLLAISFFPSGFVSTVFGNGASFQGLGDLPGGEYRSYGYGVSSDGSVVVGYSVSASGREVFRWTAEGGMVSLGSAYTAYGVSSNGSVIVGDSYFGTTSRQAFRWTPDGGVVGLGYLTGASKSGAYGVSADGSVVVGISSVSSTVGEAFRWTSGEGMVGLGDLEGGEYWSHALATSANGSVVVGYGNSASGQEAFRWTSGGGMVGLSDLQGGSFWSCSNGVSADGSVVVGQGSSASGREAFRWTSASGMVGLGDFAGGEFRSNALATSADGSIVVGSSSSTFNVNSYARYGEAFYWTESGGMQNLKDMLINLGADLTAWDSTTWTLTAATGISADGKTIVGYGFNGGSPEAWIATIPEPATPPVADADGPYTIFVGDVLTLDASGSIDDDNDIVSYIWDLDDNNSFETDAGGQVIFDVNFAELQLLGLLINHTYTIHLKVTDSEGQSDTADSTLTIIPKPAVKVAVDIKPGSCPNPLNVKSSGVLPIAILGTADYDVTTIDPASVRLAGVEPLRSGYEDVAGPVTDTNDCNCTEAGPDGYLDLTLKFKTQEIVEAIGEVNDGDVLTLELTGVLFDPIPFERPIEGADCILIRGRHKPFNKADINKDGVVNNIDFALIAENWLESSVLDD
jgi:probable HAF family extracellular repeat protein